MLAGAKSRHLGRDLSALAPTDHSHNISVDGLFYLSFAIEGPAIVEEMDSTTVIHPGFHGEVDRYGNLLVRTAQQVRPNRLLR